jgi:uncharacterized protein (TIGR01319 family)
VNVALLADFGSTFTKVLAVDLDAAVIAGHGLCPSGGDLMDSYDKAAGAALGQVRGPATVALELAASSAGGGLRMAAVGLVPELTALAAQTAALNAGARLLAVLAGRLTGADAARLSALAPEIVLFAGGTDDGQQQRVLDNAAAIAGSLAGAHVVVACNRAVGRMVAGLLAPGAASVTVVPNVLPELGRTRTGPAREEIGRLFLRHVIAGKRLSASPRFAALVRMATPDAVLRAAVLCAETAGSPGEGPGAIVTDVGGATTDVYSAVPGPPAARAPLVSRPVMRTVQGDLGLRSGAAGVLAADGGWLAAQFPAPAYGPGWLAAACARRQAEPAAVYGYGPQLLLDRALAVSCLARALQRHAGTRVVRPGPGGRAEVRHLDPDLTGCRVLVAGGGLLRAADRPEEVVRAALDRLPAAALAPRQARVVIDRGYVLAAAGLLAPAHPKVAADLLRHELPEAIS